MKKLSLVIFMLCFSAVGFPQGIAFEHGTWKDILAKSKQTKKPVFVDVYTSWCAPCKKMDKEIFPLAEVGAIYNSTFVCYQIDAEKGEGIEIAKKYNVMSFPTFLFIKGDGSLFYKALGADDAKEFIGIVAIALADMNDPKPLVVWQNEYPQKKNDPDFILNYIEKRTKLGLANALLFDEYLRLIPTENRTSDTAKKIYEHIAGELKVNSFAYENFQQNITKFDNDFVCRILDKIVLHTTDEAAHLRNEQMLNAAIAANDQLLLREEFSKEDPLPKVSYRESNEQIYMRYYRLTGDVDKFVKYATDFCNRSLMNIPPDSLFAKDSVNLRLFLKFAPQDSTQLAQLKQYYATAETSKVSAGLNSTASYICQKVSDKNILREALRWSDRAIELTPKNPFWIITNANLRYKLGQKAAAVSKGEEALRFADKNNREEYKTIEDTLLKIKAGEKTWE